MNYLIAGGESSRSPLIRERWMGQFYFGDSPQRWANIQPALTG